MPTTYYHTLNGELLGETGPGGRRFYGKDALGSVVATYDQNGTLENTYRYKPYGGLLSKTGSAPDPRFMWTGSTGSRTTGANYAEQYNRARHYGSRQAGWTSIDPLWPQQPAYIYCGDSPVLQVDPIGLCGNIQLDMPSPPSDPPKPKLSCNEHSLGERYCTYSTKFGNIGQDSVAYTIPKISISIMLRNKRATRRIIKWRCACTELNLKSETYDWVEEQRWNCRGCYHKFYLFSPTRNSTLFTIFESLKNSDPECFAYYHAKKGDLYRPEDILRLLGQQGTADIVEQILNFILGLAVTHGASSCPLGRVDGDD